MIWYDVQLQLVTLLPWCREQCVLHSLSCAVKKNAYRPVPENRNKCTVPCHREKKSTVPSRRERNYIPSRPVVKNYMHRPAPSSKNIYTAPSCRDKIYLPSRPVVTILLTVPSRRDNFHLTSRAVVKQKGHCTVPSRPVEKIHTHRPVPSHPGNYNFHYFTVPSRLHFFPAKHVKTVPSRLEYYKPWKALKKISRVSIFLFFVYPRVTE